MIIKKYNFNRGDILKNFTEYLESIDNLKLRNKLKDIFDFIRQKFPLLKEVIKWNNPMYTDNGKFIVGFSTAKEHISVAPEQIIIQEFEEEIKKSGYSYGKSIFRIKINDKVNYDLISAIIEKNIKEKKNMKKFWRE